MKGASILNLNMLEEIPEGSTLQRLNNGDILITLPGAAVPYLCVQRDSKVRKAIVKEPVDASLAEAARLYVKQHLSS
jgi:beta-galactosidase beta subunit